MGGAAAYILSYDAVDVDEAAAQVLIYLCQAKAEDDATDESDDSFNA